MLDKSIEVVNVNYTTYADLEMFPSMSEVHGIHPPNSANEENLNDAGTKVGPTPTGNNPGMSSYTNVTGVPIRKALNFRTLLHHGKRRKCVAYPVVANYVRNTWGKYGLVKSMLNSSTRIFSFQFRSMKGLDAMLENVPWFIRNNLLILKK
nr:hypothetical protein [Tanacetum cinerariifolium]